MSDDHPIEPDPHDNELADFADRVLSGEPVDDHDLAGGDLTLREMKKTIVRSGWRPFVGLRRGISNRRRRPLYAAAMVVALLLPLAIVVVLTSDGYRTQLFGTVGNNSYPGANLAFVLPVGRNQRVSVTLTAEGNQDSFASALSADGRLVAFSSAADNLVGDDDNFARDVFILDRETGALQRVSVRSDGGEADGDSSSPALSAVGRFVAFESVAANLVDGDGNHAADIFVHDRQTGQTGRVSVGAGGVEAQGQSRGPAINADGRLVVFWSDAPNLVVGDGNSLGDIFLHDRQTGVTERISQDASGQDADGPSRNPDLDAGGRYVVFESLANDLAGSGGGFSQIYWRDRQSGFTRLLSALAGGEPGNGHSYNPAISADGRFVAFHSQATNMVGGDQNNAADVFVVALPSGPVERVSLNSFGDEADGSSGYAALSGDGRYVAFASFAGNLAAGELYGHLDVFLRDRLLDATERASADAEGREPNGVSVSPAISAGGRFVSFDSAASNLVAGDQNGRIDVFVRDRQPDHGLAINYRTGAPGSVFTLSGSRFIPNDSVSLVVNGHLLGSVTTDADGGFVLWLTSAGAGEGIYVVTAAAGLLSATTGLTLDAAAELRAQEGSGPTIAVPPGIAFHHALSLPAAFR